MVLGGCGGNASTGEAGGAAGNRKRQVVFGSEGASGIGTETEEEYEAEMPATVDKNGETAMEVLGGDLKELWSVHRGQFSAPGIDGGQHGATR